jgi:biopolymer transport protein ExbB/TolQ
MIDIIFILLIGGVFFWDLIEFQKNQNVKIHRLLIPIGFLGSFVSIYLGNFTTLEEFLFIVHNSLMSLIVSVLAFLIILAIKLFLAKPEIKEDKNIKFDEIMNILETIKHSNKNEIYIKEIKKEIEKIKEHKTNNSKEIAEIKKALSTLTEQFDDDVKRFQQESMAIKGNSVKQIEVIVKLLSKQTNIMEEKIKYFENKLQKIENKKFTVDDDIINSFSKNIELTMSKMDINLDTIKRSIDTLYDKEKSFEMIVSEMENKLVNLNEKIDKFNQVFDKDNKIEHLLNVNKEFKYILDGFADVKEQFIFSLHKIKINSDMVNEAKEEIFSNLQESFASVENKLIEIIETHFHDRGIKVPKKLSPQEIAISKYNSSLEE